VEWSGVVGHLLLVTVLSTFLYQTLSSIKRRYAIAYSQKKKRSGSVDNPLYAAMPILRSRNDETHLFLQPPSPPSPASFLPPRRFLATPAYSHLTVGLLPSTSRPPPPLPAPCARSEPQRPRRWPPMRRTQHRRRRASGAAGSPSAATTPASTSTTLQPWSR
jgi:hypothetical protein